MTVKKLAKRLNSDCGLDEVIVTGNYVTYVAAEDGIVSLLTNAELWDYNGLFHDYTRAGSGYMDNFCKSPADKGRLRDEVAIIFGPKLSASDAISVLEDVIKSIRHHGLAVGQNQNSDWLHETVSGKTRTIPRV